MMSRQTFTYTKVKSPYTVLIDPDLGLEYIRDLDDIGNRHFLRETSLKFIKLLSGCGFVQLSSEGTLLFRPFLSYQDIDLIVSAIHEEYVLGHLVKGPLNPHFYDSDMHDDIFDHFEVVTPSNLIDEEWRKNFVEQHGYKFQLSKRGNSLNGLNSFLKDRARLFCYYIFLRRCAILFRDNGCHEPLLSVLRLLTVIRHNELSTDAEAKENLRAADIKYANDNWKTGLHEWLTCEKTIHALMRTAGIVEDVSTRLEPVEGWMTFPNGQKQWFSFSEFNWLDFQFLIRTPTKFVIFLRNLHGHPGAVSTSLYNGKKGSCQEFSNEFHDIINDYFDKSTSIADFMYSVYRVYYTEVLHDQNIPPVFLRPTVMAYLSDGTPVTDYPRLAFFQQTKLREPRENMQTWLRDIFNQLDIAVIENGETICYQFKYHSILPENKYIETVNNIENNGVLVQPRIACTTFG